MKVITVSSIILISTRASLPVETMSLMKMELPTSNMRGAASWMAMAED